MAFRNYFKHGVLVFVVAIIAFGLTACNGDSEQTSLDDTKNEKTYTLNLNSVYPPPKYEDSPKSIFIEKFAKLVEERTNGRVKIDVFYSGQLVKPDQALEAVSSGTVDMVASAPYWGEVLPTLDFAFLPFGFLGTEHAYHVLNETEIGKIMEKNLAEYGAKVLMYRPTGIEGIISKEPIEEISDMEGKKIRLGSGIWTDWYRSMGVAPANIAGAEQYQALQRGVIDATMYVFYAVDTYKLHEVAKHITIPGVLDPIYSMNMISMKKWKELPSDIQDTIMEVADEIEKEAFSAMDKMTKRAMDAAKENGVTIHQLTDESYQEFKESAQIVWEEYASINSETKKIVEILKKDQKKYLKAHPNALEWEKKYFQ